MTIDLIKNEITSFLKDTTPEIFILKGNWGVGKTHLWEKLLEDSRDKKEIKLINHDCFEK